MEFVWSRQAGDQVPRLAVQSLSGGFLGWLLLSRPGLEKAPAPHLT
jgi:hypothetical protein